LTDSIGLTSVGLTISTSGGGTIGGTTGVWGGTTGG